MKTCMIEACQPQDKGSIGAYYVMHHAREAGFEVDYKHRPSMKYDVELISVHHCSDFLRVAKMPKRAKVRIVGGHPMQNNPRPIIPYADIVCIGEGESWIKSALGLLKKYKLDINSLKELPGTIITGDHEDGDKIPDALMETPLPDNPPYLNRPDTRSAAWYIEIARGCPYKCSFCELGNSTKFRLYSIEKIKKTLDACDLTKTKKINFYAPDEASHPGYGELFDYMKERGFLAGFSSMRIESVMRKMPPIRANQLIRVGIDGLSERIRNQVNKPISDDMIVEYFKKLVDQGHVTFKCFFIFSYPGETMEDFKCFERLMRRILSIPLKKNLSLRIKWTPFIPQPCTPMKDEGGLYNFMMAQNIEVWHAKNRRPYNTPGWFIENDGMMGMKSHKLQCALTKGNEGIIKKLFKNIGGDEDAF